MSLATESLAPSNYYAKQVFNQEQAAVFQQNWHFVGFVQQLEKPNDFITKTIGGVPVVVQNIQGELFALQNVCSHRKATIQVASAGNRPLRCPYHCWTYGKSGRLGSVPQDRTDFALSAEQREALALREYQLATCGDFVFVRVAKTGSSLEQFLGEHYNTLQSLSEYFKDPIESGHFDWQTNWKIAVETVLEVYHVPGVHPESFSKLALPKADMQKQGKHNTGHTPLQDASQKWWAGVRKRLKLTQHPDFNEYNHFFIYPNLAIGLTNGSLMSVQTYEPVDETHSRLNFALRMVSKENGELSSAAIKQAVQQNFTSFNHDTLEEDREVAESCQQNMQVNDTPGVLGLCEGRITHFHESWRNDMTQAEQSTSNVSDINQKNKIEYVNV